MGQNKEMTIRQVKHFWKLVDKGIVHRDNFQDFLDNPDRFVKAAFPIWKTVKLGVFKNADGARRALSATGCRIGDWTNGLLDRIVFSPIEREVHLVSRSVAELGFPRGATLAQIYETAPKLGLSLCPAEVGPALREQYRDQPMGEWLVIAMEPVAVSFGGLRLFRVGRRDDALWLGSGCGRPECLWFAGLCFVVVSGK